MINLILKVVTRLKNNERVAQGFPKECIELVISRVRWTSCVGHALGVHRACYTQNQVTPRGDLFGMQVIPSNNFLEESHTRCNCELRFTHPIENCKITYAERGSEMHLKEENTRTQKGWNFYLDHIMHERENLLLVRGGSPSKWHFPL